MQIKISFIDRQRHIFYHDILACTSPKTIEEILKQSQIQAHFPWIQFPAYGVGIFGQAVNLHRLVQEGDRIEIYSPLLCKPNEQRVQKILEKNKKKT